MAFTPGDFTPSNDHAEVIMAAEEMWANPRLRKHYDQPVETLKAVADNQTVSIDPILQDAYGCRSVKLWWTDSCDMTVETLAEHTYSCQNSGAEMASDSTTHDKNLGFVKQFTVRDDECKDLATFTEKVTRGIERCKAAIRKNLNTSVASTIEANAMANKHSGSPYPKVGTETQIPSTYWNADLIAHLQYTAEMNQINNPILLDGGNMYEQDLLANFKTCCDNEGDRNLLGHFGQPYYDLRSLHSHIGQKVTYLFEPSVIGFWSAWNYDNIEPQQSNDQFNTWYYRERDEVVTSQDIWYDITIQRVCINPDKANTAAQKWGWNYKVIWEGGVIVAPDACSAGSGILKFVNV